VGTDDIGAMTRRAVRDVIADKRVLVQATLDIRSLLLEEEDDIDVDIVQLWDDKHGFLQSGVDYASDSEDEADLTEGYGEML